MIGRDLPNETRVSGATSSAPAATAASITPTPPHSANAELREAAEAREKRARLSGATRPGPSRSNGGGIATLSDLTPSEESHRCVVCGGESVSGNELVRCAFGDGRCIQGLGESTARRACWHAVCVAKFLHIPRPQHVVCARHEADARFRLHVHLSRERQQEYTVLSLGSYKNGALDSASNETEV